MYIHKSWIWRKQRKTNEQHWQKNQSDNVFVEEICDDSEINPKMPKNEGEIK